RVPLAAAIAEGEDALPGARLLLVAPGAAERGVESALRERLQQSLRLQREGVLLAGVVERVDPFFERALVAMDDEPQPMLRDVAIAEGVHVAELPGRVDVQQRERDGRRM